MSSKKLKPRLNESVMSVRSNHSRKPRLDSTMLSSGFSQPVLVSQEKSRQDEIDITYSKYLQSVAIGRLLAKKNREVEQALDQQLTQHSEILDQKIEETELFKNQIKTVNEYKDLTLQILFLDNILRNDIVSVSNTEHIKMLTDQLQALCDKLYLDGMKINNDYVGERLLTVVGKLLKISEEIKGGTSEEFIHFVENVRKFEELLKKIKIVHQNVMKSLNISNKLVLKAASMQLSKDLSKTDM